MQNMLIPDNGWFFRIFQQINLFADKQYEYPADEAGQQVKRQLAQKSWFDKITSEWVQRSFFKKFTSITSATMVAAILGMLIGAPVLSSIAMLVISISVHKLFVMHENSRYERALFSAKELIAKGKELDTIQTHLNQTTATFKDQTIILKNQSVAMGNALSNVESECLSIQSRNETLTMVVADIKQTNQNLRTQADIVTKDLSAISSCLITYEQTMETVIASTKAHTEEQAAFSETIKIFSQQAQQFCMFNSAPKETNNDDLDDLEALLSTNQKIIDNWPLLSKL